MILNKIRNVIILSIISLLLITLNAYLGFRAHQLSLKLKNQGLILDNAHNETLEARKSYDIMQKDYAKLQRDYGTLISERDNLFLRMKGLLVENERKKELEVSLENTKKDMQLLEKTKEEILEQGLALKGQIEDLQTIQKQLIKEKEQLQETIEQEKDKSGLKNLEQENLSLRSAKNTLADSLKQKDAEIDKLKTSESKLKQEVSLLNKQVENFNKNYAEAIKKNKEFEASVGQLPTKFAELARQNKLLIKRTANIHYNMGVFYTQQKEYARATAEFEKALELNPEDAYAHFNLGYIYAEYLRNSPKAVEHFRQYLRNAKKDDKDVDWAKKYILTCESWGGQKPVE